MARRRRSVRTRLMLLYAIPFFASGVVLLAAPILQIRESAPVGTFPVGSAPDPNPGAPLHQLVVVSATSLILMSLVALVLGWFIAGRFLRPLRAITATARDISASNLHRRVGPAGRNDEFTELAETLDSLFARLEASFSSQRHFVANASHELRTPLTAERALLQVALADPAASAESLRAACQEVLALGQSQERLIDALLTLASSEQGIEQREPVELAGIAGAVVLSRQTEASRRGLLVSTQLSAASVSGDPDLLTSLVANLVDNALRHNVTGGRIEVATNSSSGRSHLVVSNTGPVIPPDEVGRLFQPFQQYGQVRYGDGHGLGLAIVAAIAQAHGAAVAPTPLADGGLSVDVTFP